MEVEVLAIKKVVTSHEQAQAAMFIVSFGDVITSQVFRVTSSRFVREINKANKSGNMPKITAFAATDSPGMLFQLKFKP